MRSQQCSHLSNEFTTSVSTRGVNTVLRYATQSKKIQIDNLDSNYIINSDTSFYNMGRIGMSLNLRKDLSLTLMKLK